MKAMLLALALTATTSAWAAAADQTAQTAPAILQQDRSKLLVRVEEWRDYLAKCQAPVQDKYGPELMQVKAAAEAAQTIEDFRPVELRLDGWKRALLGELFPFLNTLSSQPGASERLAQAQVEAFNVVAKLRANAVSGDSQKFLDNVAARISVVKDARDLSWLFDKAQLSGSAPIPASGFSGANGAGSNPYQSKGFVMHDVPSPLALDASDRARFAKVAAALRGRGASQNVIDLTIAEAIRQRVDPLLVLALVQNESGFQTGATSAVGARGLMQIMPDTGRGLGVSNPNQLYNAQTNLRAGVSFLKGLWGRFSNFSFSSLSGINPFSCDAVKKAIAAYNAGPGAVEKYGGVPPYRETCAYVANVLKTYVQLRRIYSSGS
jgi:soluble lytic murein transglycosylase-like protein